ncbi:Type IV leader peptidase family protein [Planctomycetes bacterium CA13]|uniref:Type IV leader peptidase family protein n=1 Tax=Novipirellula herctigrandis TaxID=2527986 RepID=A0A5C5YNM1_9BACT|nr:Type IV leader peptidase family protein [Planctomycetes bacterium CA13]
MPLRLMLLAFFGIVGGAIANYVIYTWCWFPRPIDPWAPPPKEGSPRRSMDRVPIIGWFSLRREAALHGRGFWIRPLLIELGLAITLPLLYFFETQTGGLLPIDQLAEAQIPAVLSGFARPGHQIFFAHSVLLLLMVAATFIDFDEQTIPDEITIPGTIFALILASISYGIFMPTSLPIGGAPTTFEATTFEMPWQVNPKWWSSTGLMTGLAIWTGWCFALADRRLILRRGLTKAIEFFFAGLVRHRTWKILVAIWIVGIVAISIVFSLGGMRWYGLFSSLIGLAVGGGVIWAIRLIASSAMGVEAMGFGDVTLMAMIGAFIGWQAAVIAFFLSPFAAIAIVIVQYIVTREPRVPFGPYLCAGTCLTVIFWNAVMNQWFLPNLLFLGSFILWLCIAMLGLMGAMLFVWRHIKRAIFSH